VRLLRDELYIPFLTAVMIGCIVNMFTVLPQRLFSSPREKDFSRHDQKIKALDIFFLFYNSLE
jgi:hypothetical protein